MSHDGPRILTFDIETRPTLAYVWGLFNQNIALSQIVEPTRIICFAAKWYGDDDVIFKSEFHDGHRATILTLFDLLDEADVVITYNGDNFDIPHAEREFLEADIGTPSPFHSIDLYKVLKKKTKFVSHKLAHITESLSLTGKLETGGFDLWRDVMAGDRKAWAKMRRYNKQDVVTTEELYDEVLHLIDTHPALTLYVDDDAPACPRCLSDQLERRGYAYTRLGKYQRYQCQSCGSWGRGGKRVEGVDVR